MFYRFTVPRATCIYFFSTIPILAWECRVVFEQLFFFAKYLPLSWWRWVR